MTIDELLAKIEYELRNRFPRGEVVIGNDDLNDLELYFEELIYGVEEEVKYGGYVQ